MDGQKTTPFYYFCQLMLTPKWKMLKREMIYKADADAGKEHADADTNADIATIDFRMRMRIHV